MGQSMAACEEHKQGKEGVVGLGELGHACRITWNTAAAFSGGLPACLPSQSMSALCAVLEKERRYPFLSCLVNFKVMRQSHGNPSDQPQELFDASHHRSLPWLWHHSLPKLHTLEITGSCDT